MKFLKDISKFAVVIGCLIWVCSCVPQKKMMMLQEAEMISETQSKVYENERNLNYKLQPGDNLYIRANNILDSQASGIGSEAGVGTARMTSEASIYLNSYTISQDGFVEMPLVGKINVINLTIEEAEAKIEAELSRYVNETSIVIKLSSFNLTVLGEVSKPGTYKLYQPEVNIMEAIAVAGNMSSFAKRDQVKLIRRTDTGSEIITLDLEKADILSSPYYYLKPNDIVYVEPMKIKQWGFTSFPYSTVMSIISLGITLFTLTRKL